MLRACVIDFKGSWDDHLPLIEFSYNNSYLLKHSMAGDVGLQLGGSRLESHPSWVHRSFMHHDLHKLVHIRSQS